jgi:transcription-repair coupling factor (superfamily II helicase)
LVKKVQSAPDTYRLEGANSFRFRLNDDSTSGKLDAIAAMLTELTPDTKPAKAS